MKNLHIIVGEPRRCLCGVYDGQSVGCQELIEILDKIERFDPIDALPNDEAVLLNKVLRPCIKEC